MFYCPVESSGSDTLKSSAVIPPPTVLDRVLKDIFHDGTVASPFLYLLFDLMLH